MPERNEKVRIFGRALGLAALSLTFLNPVEARAQSMGGVGFDQSCFGPVPLLRILSVDFPKGIESAVVLRAAHLDFQLGFTYTEWEQLQRMRIPQTMSLISGESYSLALMRLVSINPKTGAIEVDRHGIFFSKEFKARECGFFDVPTSSL